ncbi:MAG: anthranilate synthase component I family protein, partial [Planctomycetes bacterium]|nr:anthranilate synthase component I family protein [Planctomycetota bacterium]
MDETPPAVGGAPSPLEPIVLEVACPLPPASAFLRLASLPYVIFLDSAAPGGPRGRYSYIAAEPLGMILARGRRLTVLARDERAGGAPVYRAVERSDSETDPLGALERRLGRWSSPRDASLPPFTGGAAGLFGYGLSRSIERLPAPRRDELEVPDLAVGIYDQVLAFDHEQNTCRLVGQPIGRGGSIERRRAAERRMRRILDHLEREPGESEAARLARESGRVLAADALGPLAPLPGKRGVWSNFPRDGYLRAVRRAIDYIHAGDIFQVNLSQRLLARCQEDPATLYLRLRQLNPAPFAGYADLGGHVVISSSPEQFLAVESGEVITRPIKGTRPRGRTAAEDERLAAELLRSEKDRAENVMIVDLLRNDLSRVCEPGSVDVPSLFELERHPTVLHLVSEVRGMLREGASAVDLLRSAFPGGSITGAPKVRAMEIIAELEPSARGAYCGSLGWISFAGDMNSSILIRTMTASRGWIELPA